MVELPGEPVAHVGVRIQSPIVAIAAGEETVWVSARFAGGVVRVEAASGRVLDVVVCTASALAADSDGVWVVGGGDGVLRRIDANETRAREVAAPGADLRDVLVAFGSVWVVDNATGEVVRVNRSTGDVVARIPVLTRSAPPRIAASLDGWAVQKGTPASIVPGLRASVSSVWVGSVLWPAADAIDHRFGQIELVRIDPERNERIASVTPPVLASAFAVDDDEVFVIGRSEYSADGSRSPLMRISVDDGEVIATGAIEGHGVFGSAIADGEAGWLTAGRGQLFQITREPFGGGEVRWAEPAVPVRERRVVGGAELGGAPEIPALFEEWQRNALEQMTVVLPGSREPALRGPGLEPITDGKTQRWLGLSHTPVGGGLSFDEVRLRGSFPDTRIEVLFGCPRIADCRYGWHHAIWNAAASRRQSQPVQAEDLEYLRTYLDEDIGTRLPYACDPDEEGITWIGGQPVSLRDAARRVPFDVLVPARPPYPQVHCTYIRRRRSDGLGISIVYRSEEGDARLQLNESSRWPKWLDTQAWSPTEHRGVEVELLDPKRHSLDDSRHGWWARRRIDRTHVVAGPGPHPGALLEVITAMETVAPADSPLVDRPEVAYDLAIEAEILGDEPAALAAFRQAGASEHPWFAARAWYRVAHILQTANDLSGAEDAFRDAAYVNGGASAMAAVNLGALLNQRGEHEAAVREWRRVRELDNPDQAALATINIGAIEFKQGNLHAARQLFTEVVNANIPARSAQAGVFLGLTHERAGDLLSAREALSLAGTDPDEEWSTKATIELNRLADKSPSSE